MPSCFADLLVGSESGPLVVVKIPRVRMNRFLSRTVRLGCLVAMARFQLLRAARVACPVMVELELEHWY